MRDPRPGCGAAHRVCPVREAVTGHVIDTQNAPVAGARILARNGSVLAVTDLSGNSLFPPPCRRSKSRRPDLAPSQLRLAKRLRPDRPQAGRRRPVGLGDRYLSPLSSLDSPASTRNLTTTELNEAASPVLDDKIRLIPGAELFRRSSSLVANPTSQGISLRGLGSTAASRTLVLSNDIPVLDPYGAWIHWEEFPELSVKSVDVVRGGVSDLYGSSAIGGVITSFRSGRRGTRSICWAATVRKTPPTTGFLVLSNPANGAAWRPPAWCAPMATSLPRPRSAALSISPQMCIHRPAWLRSTATSSLQD